MTVFQSSERIAIRFKQFLVSQRDSPTLPDVQLLDQSIQLLHETESAEKKEKKISSILAVILNLIKFFFGSYVGQWMKGD